jgi:16S rRNA (adenine1518-N6/adenine1519-N6)-dimethyltransferase
MQTKQQIQQLLTSAGASINKRLGQHFLIDLNLMRLLIDSADISDNDIVLEVGCGTGSLTEGLAEHAGYCIAVEYDRILADIAKSRLTKAKNVKIIHADILKNKHTINPLVSNALASARKKYTGRILLVANLPYNVASPVMLNLVTGPLVVDSMCVTVQKQVADRMTASPACPERTRGSRRDSKEYGILSILLSATGDIKLIRNLKPTVFWPAPKVDSAIVRFVRNKEKVHQIKDMKLFSEVVGLFMCHRRKTLTACSKLADSKLAKVEDWQDIFNRASIDPRKRPEQLSPEEYIAIANLCDEIIG